MGNNQIYRLKDIQNLLKVKSLPWNVLSIQPLEVNYLIEDKISTKEVCEIYNSFKKSSSPLHIHLSLQKVVDDCYIKLKEEDANIIKSLT
jgi:hypothetical protein